MIDQALGKKTLATVKLFFHPITFKFLLLSAITWWMGNLSVLAQSNPIGNSPNFNEISPGKFNDVRPVRRQFQTDLQGGSQDFFRRGDEGLYFLPTEDSEPILEIDQQIESDQTEDRKPFVRDKNE